MNRNAVFAITGVAGYIAPRHLHAIKDTDSTVVAALDTHDSVGVLDQYFPDAAFFTEYERFDRHLEKLRRTSDAERVNMVSICSPNHLHDAHIRLALRIGADALCEKPLVLNPWNLDALAALEEETRRKVYTVLQLRLHPALLALKETLAHNTGKRHDVTLRYVTTRGLWYRYSWKGDESRSGGIVTNIGIHFFDLLLWLFGGVSESVTETLTPSRASGTLVLANADVRWMLSVEAEDLPPEVVAAQKRTWRSITIDGEEVDFTDGFTDLHTRVYQETLSGRGFGIEDARPSIELVHRIRTGRSNGER